MGATATTSGANGSIATKNDAVAETLEIVIPVTWNVSTAVNLSSLDDGNTYVWNGTAPELASNNSSLVKTAAGTVTFGTAITKTGGTALTSEQRTLLDGKEFTVKINATNQVRLATSMDVNTTAVGRAYDEEDETWKAVQEIVLTSKIKLHTASGGASFSSIDNATQTFYYSISPDNASGLETKTVGASYGGVSATLE